MNRPSFRRIVHIIALLLALAMPAFAQRQMERLGRGVVAVKSSSTQVYVGWRLLGNDPEDVAFNLYRSANGGAAVKVNGTPLTATTDYLDTPASLGTTAYTYSVKPVVGGVEVADIWANLASGPVTLPANAPTRQYLPVPLQQTPDGVVNGNPYRVKFCWVGDLDGDGEFDFVVERTNSTVEAAQWVQAYKRDGTLLWQMNMGPNSVDHYNITPGSSAIGIGHGDNLTVYDMDGDGLAEVIVRTANGVVFGNGTPLTAPNNEVQYISILNGLTGAERARATVPVPAGWATQTHMNGQMGIVYADGMRPSIFFHTSNRNADQSFNHVATTWDFRNGVLTQRWTWPFTGHTAEGHQIRLADVNNDGTDEYIDIGHVLKADGTAQINAGVLTDIVHGDRFHVTDIDPDRPGLETFLIQQNNSTGLATAYHSADKSTVIKKQYASSLVDVGRGTTGAFVPNLRGLQFFSTVGGTFDSKGVELYPDSPFPPETIWWDGNLAREFLSTIGQDANSPGIDRFNTADPANTSRVFTIYSDPAAPGSPYNNYIADGGRPQFWGDILGDWREELICVASDQSELRIYTTKTVDEAKSFNGAPFRIYTLMHNPQYRIQTTTKGYVQSSYVDYYLGYTMSPPPPPPMVDAKLVWRGGAGATTWDAGATQSWKLGTANSAFANGDTVRFDISGDATTNVALTGTLQPGAVTVFSPKDYAFTGTGALAGTMKLTKSGAGKLTLSGAHTFSGKTTIWDGALVVNGSLSSSPVTVWGGTWGGAFAAGQTGGRLAGTGTVSQLVTVKSRGAITPGAGMGSAGTLTCAGGLTAEDSATFALDLSNNPAGAGNDRIAVTGALALSGAVKIVVNPLNGSLGAGTYTLLTYTSATGGLANLSVVLPEGTPGTLAMSGGAVTLTVPTTRAPGAVTWRGTGANWDLAASQNWLLGASPDVFVAGDSVTFNATGAAAPSLTLTTALPVAGVTVNAASDYTFSGAGYLSGAGGLTKSGAGTLTVSTTNTYTGPTVVNGGVLAVASLGDAGSPGSLGAASAAASNFILNGGTLRLTGGQTNTNRAITLSAGGGTFDIPSSGSSIQTSGVIGGSGALIKSGSGTLLLTAANTYAGGTIINGGKIFLTGSTANSSGLGSGSVTINGGTLSMADVQASETGAWNLVVPTGATGRLDADGRCSLTGSLTGGGTFTYYTPYVRTDLDGNWSAFTGQINAITDGDGGDFRIMNPQGYGNAALDLGDNVNAYYNDTVNVGGTTIAIGQLSGVSTARLRGGPTGGRTLTYEVGGKNTDSLFEGGLRDGSGGPMAFRKVGTGTLTLGTASTGTHTAGTTVVAGALVVNGSLTGSAVAVQSSATLGGSGTITGDVTVSSGGKLAFTASGGGVTGLTITGNLTLNGTITVTPVAGTGAFAQGTHTIATYSGTLGGTPSFVFVPAPGQNQTATFDTGTPGVIKINVLRGAATLTWTGTTSSAWNTTTANWLLNGLGELFISGDSGLFDDTAANTTVAAAGLINSGGALFSNTTNNYTLNATAGGLTGALSLQKTGTGALSLTGANTHTGGTTIAAGTVTLTDEAASNGAFGTGPLTLAGGTVQMRDDTASFSATTLSIVVPAGASPTLRADSRVDIGGTLTGAGTLNFYTPWIRTNLLLNMSAFTGTLAATTDGDGGNLRIAHSAGLPAAAVQLANKVGAHYFGNAALTVPLGELSGVTGSTLSGLNNNNNAVNPHTFTWEVGARGTDAIFAGNITNGASPSITAIRKVGAGKWTLAGTCTYTGATSVLAGTLCIAGTASGSASFTVAAGAALEVHEGGSLSIAGSLTNNGTVRIYGTPTFSPTGGFVNNGTLDLLNSSGALPPNFVNNGVVLLASEARAESITLNAGVVTVAAMCHPGHTYKLQTTPTLISPTWTDVAGSTFTPGGSGSHAFTHSAPGAPPRFYRVVIAPSH